ncbi:hypothetical protein PHYBOEH_009170 [Phytophthora boehmeriae]|uniref:Carbohydrate esterase n=1 Tax=Phytophthora boehmeriae TaxID=109152 RepID=A0A8T1VZ15_9STRA|nr:hypothetical protein PHYBOEH_009170 [Phytophthora boehmeriae]
MFKDWNVVFVPYCTGDVFIGNKVVPARESGIEGQLGNPQCLGLDYPMHMNGYNNTMSALSWALQNYPDVDQLVLAGSSAGSLGSQLYSAQVAKMWDVDAKGTKFSVMADSYVGFFPSNHPIGETMEYFGACSNGLDYPERITAACKAKTASTAEIVEALLERRPTDDWLFINSMGDQLQRYYYALVEQGIQGFPFSKLMSEEDFYRNVSEILEAYQSVNPHVSTIYMEGKQHTFLMDSNFTDYKSNENVRLGDYINNWLASKTIDTLNTSISMTTAPDITVPTGEDEDRTIDVNPVEQQTWESPTQHQNNKGAARGSSNRP